jgi:hypothetical protein
MSSQMKLNSQEWSPPRPPDNADLDWSKRPPDKENKIARIGCRLGCLILGILVVIGTVASVKLLWALIRALGGHGVD